MDISSKGGPTSKNIFRISISFIVATITAKIVFIIMWSITFIPIISTIFVVKGIVTLTAVICASISGVFCFKKLNDYLTTEIKNI